METIITIISSLVGGGVIGSVITIFTEKNKRQMENHLLEADLLDKIENSYEKLITHFNKRFDDLINENKALEEEKKKINILLLECLKKNEEFSNQKV